MRGGGLSDGARDLYASANLQKVLYCSPAVSASMQCLRAPRIAPYFSPATRRVGIRRCKMTVSPRASLQDLVRLRGVFVPNNVVQDFTTLTGAALFTTAIYVALTKKKPTGRITAGLEVSVRVIVDMHAQAALLCAATNTLCAGTKDKVLLASSSAIFWYAGRYLFFGVRWGATSSIWLMDKVEPIASSSQFKPCPYQDPTQCDLYSVPFAQAPQAGTFMQFVNSCLPGILPLREWCSAS